MKKILASLLVVSVIIFSCKKDTPAPVATTFSAWSACTNGVQTRTLLTGSAPADSLSRACDYSSITSGSWKMTADSVYVQELNQTFEIIQDTSVFGEVYPPCVQDDLYTFMTGGAYTYTDAGMACSPNGSYTDGTWTISSNNLIWDGQTAYPAALKYFSSTKMVTNVSFTSTSGGTTYHFVEKTTYTKQ